MKINGMCQLALGIVKLNFKRIALSDTDERAGDTTIIRPKFVLNAF